MSVRFYDFTKRGGRNSCFWASRGVLRLEHFLKTLGESLFFLEHLLTIMKSITYDSNNKIPKSGLKWLRKEV